MTNEAVLKILQDISNSQVEHFNCFEVYNCKHKPVEEGDLYTGTDGDEESGFINYHFKLLIDNDKLYLVDCNENNELYNDFDINEYEPLNNMNKQEINRLMEDLIHSKIFD